MQVSRDAVLLSVEHHYSSGHMWVVDHHTDPVEETLQDLGLAELADTAARLQADAASWAPTVLLGLFVPTVGAKPDRVAPDEAEWLELGQSASPDGKLPNLTLRLGRVHDEIVLDHSFVWPERIRRLEPVAVPAGLADILAHFGEDMAAVARAHAAERG